MTSKNIFTSGSASKNINFGNIIRSLVKWGTTDIQSCPIKLPPLFRAPVVWVIPVWLLRRLMWEWCHLYLQQKYFQYISIICPVAVNITWDNNATFKAVSFYICGFIYTSSYSSPTKQMAGLYIWSPTLRHAVYHKPTVYTFSVGVMVSSLIQIRARSATINKTNGADKG